MRRTAIIVVTLDVPDGVRLTELREYVFDAVRVMAGSLPADDPMFHLDRESIKVDVVRVV